MTTGVLVLAGSSGRVDEGRVALLAAHGVTAMGLRWFGGPGQPSAPREVPLETFVPAIDRLARDCERVAVLGTSYGAEAALLLGVHDPRIDVVICFAPTSVVWQGAGEPITSKWTLAGQPLPFTSYDETWQPSTDPPAYREFYERSLAKAPDAAHIAVERIRAEVILVAGGEDLVWPSVEAARTIEARRGGLPTTVITHADAGHRTVLPGEEAVEGGQAMARGGSAEADAALGELAWPELKRALEVT